MSKEELVLEEGWDPDDFRDKLCEESWKRSGAKTLEEHIKFVSEETRRCIQRRDQEEAKRKAVQ